CAVARLFCTAAPRASTCPLSLHDALPICRLRRSRRRSGSRRAWRCGTSGVERQRGNCASHDPPVAHVSLPLCGHDRSVAAGENRSEEHTSELQSRENLVCRLLLEKKTQTT